MAEGRAGHRVATSAHGHRVGHGITRVHADYYATNADIADLLRRAGALLSANNTGGVIEEAVQLDQEALAGLSGAAGRDKGAKASNNSHIP